MHTFKWLPCTKICSRDFDGKSWNIPYSSDLLSCSFHIFASLTLYEQWDPGHSWRKVPHPAPNFLCSRSCTISWTHGTPVTTLQSWIGICYNLQCSHYFPYIAVFILYTKHIDTIKPFVKLTLVSLFFGRYICVADIYNLITNTYGH